MMPYLVGLLLIWRLLPRSWHAGMLAFVMIGVPTFAIGLWNPLLGIVFFVLVMWMLAGWRHQPR